MILRDTGSMLNLDRWDDDGDDDVLCKFYDKWTNLDPAQLYLGLDGS